MKILNFKGCFHLIFMGKMSGTAGNKSLITPPCLLITLALRHKEIFGVLILYQLPLFLW